VQAVETLVQRKLRGQTLAEAIRDGLNRLNGKDWHCLVGKDFSVNVRYWRGRFFLFEGQGIKVMVFQSAPPAPQTQSRAKAKGTAIPAPPLATVVSEEKRRHRMSVVVMRSAMDGPMEQRVLELVSEASQSVKRTGDLAQTATALK
ncbi:unnamed protein product, partial [Choristocarpus tenellus]